MDPQHSHYINLYYMRCGDNKYRTYLQRKDNMDYYL